MPEFIDFIHVNHCVITGVLLLQFFSNETLYYKSAKTRCEWSVILCLSAMLFFYIFPNIDTS